MHHHRSCALTGRTYGRRGGGGVCFFEPSSRPGPGRDGFGAPAGERVSHPARVPVIVWQMINHQPDDRAGDDEQWPAWSPPVAACVRGCHGLFAAPGARVAEDELTTVLDGRPLVGASGRESPSR